MAAILNSTMLNSDTTLLDSDTLLSSLRFTQKHSHSTLTLTQTNFNLIQTHSFSLNLMMAVHLEFCHLEFHHLGFSHHSISSQTHSHLPRLVPNICTKKLHSFIVTQLDDGSHLEFCHVEFRQYPFGFRHLVIFSQIHSKTLSLHSDSDSNLFNLINLMMAAILNSAILNSAILDSAILHKKNFTHLFSFNCDDGSHLEFCHVGFSHCLLGFRHLVFSLLFTQKNSHCTLTLTQTNSIWLKLIHSHSTWWWQPSWILPCWTQPLPSGIQTPCYLFSESLKNTLTPLWLWLKLIQSDSNSFNLI